MNNELACWILQHVSNVNELLSELDKTLSEVSNMVFNSRHELERYLKENVTCNKVLIDKIIQAFVESEVLIRYKEGRYTRYIGKELSESIRIMLTHISSEFPQCNKCQYIGNT